MSIENLQGCNLGGSRYSVYDYNHNTIQELLCEFFSKINECVDSSNKALEFMEWIKEIGLPLEVQALLQKWYEDGTLADIINRQIFEDLNNKIDNGFIDVNSQLENIENKTINFITLEDFGGVSDANYYKDGEYYVDSGFNVLATDNTKALEDAIENLHSTSTALKILGKYRIAKNDKILINKSSISITGLGINKSALFFTHENGGLYCNKTDGNGYIYEIHVEDLFIDGCNKCDTVLEFIKGEQCYFNNLSISNSKKLALKLTDSSMMYFNRLTTLDNENTVEFNNCGFIDINQSNIWNSKTSAIVLSGSNSNIIIHDTWFEWYQNIIFSKLNSYSTITIANCHILDGRATQSFFYNQESESNENTISLNIDLKDTKVIDYGCEYLFNIPSTKTNHNTLYSININNINVVLPKLKKVIKHTTPYKNIKFNINETNLENDKIVDENISCSGINTYYGTNVVIGGLYANTSLDGHIRFDDGTKRYVVSENSGSSYNFISVSKAGNERPSNKIMGDVFYDTTIQKLIVFDGGIWRDVNGAPV